MRVLLLALVMLAPGAVADHAVGHVVVPGGELVDAAAGAVDDATGGSLGNWSLLVPRIECVAHTEIEGRYLFGIPIPRRVEEAYVLCHLDERTIASPDVGRAP